MQKTDANHLALCCFGLGAVVAVMCLSVVAAERPQGDLLVNYVPPSLLQTNPSPPSVPPSKRTQSKPEISVIAQPPHEKDAIARWERFEAEFGLQKKSPTMMKGTLENTKYQVDSALFAVKDFIEHSLNFDYELRNVARATPSTAPPRRYRSNIWLDAMENARFQSDIRMDSLMGHGFVGVKLVLPIGD